MSVSDTPLNVQQNDRLRISVAGRFAPASVFALTAWSLLGCYNYIPIAATVAPANREGRVVLTAIGTTAMLSQLGPGVREIDGNLLRVTADSVVIAVAQTTTVTRERFTSTGLTVAIARPLVEQVSVRTLSRKRSLTFAVAVASFISIAFGVVVAASASSSGDGPGIIQP